MKTQVLYVLVSDSSDYYAEQAYVSMLSLRRNSPSSSITVLVDTATDKAMPGRAAVGRKIMALADRWVVADIDPSLPKVLRSRLLKTGMRSYVSGDFLFIDSDTVVCGPLDEMDDCSSDLAMCPDHHCRLDDNPVRKDLVTRCRSIGADISGQEYYFNSGVIFARDVPQVHSFFKSWQENYRQSYAGGLKTDQQPLAKTILNSGFSPAVLEGKWNCQLPYGVRYLRDAVILHYFAGSFTIGDSALYVLCDKALLDEIRRTGELPQAAQDVLEDHFKGISQISFLSPERDMLFWTTRRYRDLKRSYVPGKFSWLEFVLKVRARLPFRKK